ncbi:50S ribosomal protein L25, partial [bacterium]|nr:50S ribosomal protein L25 [bacterium]
MRTIELKAAPRSDNGTRAARRHRGSGQVPAILYGGALPDGTPNREVKHLVVPKEDLNNFIKKKGILADLQVEGEKKKEVAIVKEIQRDAFGEFVMHVDFVRVDLTKPIKVDVPLIYKGTPKGHAAGGQLRIELYTLAIEALVTDVPEEIIVKTDDLDMDDVFRMKQLTLPPGVKSLVDPEQNLCAVRAPIIEKEPEPGAAP